MSKYQPNKTFIAFPLAQAFSVLVLLAIGMAEPAVLGLLPIPVIWGLVSLFRFHPSQVYVDDGIISIAQKNGFGQSKIRQFVFDEIDFIYRNRPVRGGYTSRRGERGNVLSIFHLEARVLDLEPGNEGWFDSDIRLLVSELTHRGVKQLIDKYGDKDVVIE